ncbi:MAG: hypothetical protein KJ964_13680 [Verrucomicrobia bacterium]|nr:hypothetical protein [Verrucomicrobiota bacterium]MBU1734810.1 hypothetical protein [Verrucomicrobiota bacterium]MBU1857746.1 hypothetical protein [Verrucomicrobiota bacterium]
MSIEKLRKELRAFYSQKEEEEKIQFSADPGNGALDKGWASESFDDSRWETMSLPGSWTSKGMRFSGVFWFRKNVDVPKNWAGKDLTLRIGAVDKTDITYFNGEQVGSTGKGFDRSVWDLPRSYVVPGRLVKSGRNVIAVRAYSFAYAGGMIGPVDNMFVSPADNESGKHLSLAGDWKYAIEHKLETVSQPFWDLMDKYDIEHPGLNAMQLKAAQYEVFADSFRPVVFKDSPFYFEMGTNGGWNVRSPGRWLLNRNYHLFRDFNPEDYDLFMERINQRVFLCCGPYVDLMHHCPSFSNVLKNGLENIYAQAEAALKLCTSKDESEFIECAMRGLLAVKAIAGRFADAAEKLLKDTTDETQQRFLGMIAQSARKVPWHKPETFYEGLNTLWFLREVCGSIEGLATNSLGRPDMMLSELYRQDIGSGCLTKEEAYDLICRFLLPADCLYDKDKQVVAGGGGIAAHELEITFTLGGCDEHGNEVFNDITRMFLKAHHELKLIYPKLHCRFGKDTTPEYLEMINCDILSGRSVINLVNDDCVIPAQVRAGKRLENARNYVCSGCWDVVLESYENMATGDYFSLMRILEASIHDCPEMLKVDIICDKLDEAENFEEVYQRLFGNIIKVVRQMCAMKGRNGVVWPKVNPSPFFSACMSDCLEKRKDFTAGGGRYNPHALPMFGFANIIDSLLVIRKLCFETKHHTLTELLAAVRANWKGYEPLWAEVLSMPHFGDNTPESNALARRFHDDLYEHTRDLVNERGGTFDLGYWVYREFKFWGEKMLATPDGRHTGDVLAHGITPSRVRRINDITSTINSVAALDLTKCAGNSLLNIILPGNGVSPHLLAQFERAFADAKLQLLQLNCVSKAELLDARKHPEKHQDLVVRVCGFSAKFVALSPEWQDEFISRNIYGKTS